MCVGSPKAPEPPPRLPEAPTPPPAREGAATAAEDIRRRRAAGGTGRSTILTGPSGVTESGATSQKTLLGQ